MGVTDSQALAEVIAAVGLASCFAALRCLTDEGITEAHRRLRQSKKVPT
jgi:hydroxymethylglutaryl-CoA reductase